MTDKKLVKEFIKTTGFEPEGIYKISVMTYSLNFLKWLKEQNLINEGKEESNKA